MTDEFLAPGDFAQAESVLLQAIEKRTLELQGRQLLEKLESKSAFCGLIGGSTAMRKVYQAIQAVADSNATVLLRGESGSGKELVAQAIVQSGERRGQTLYLLKLFGPSRKPDRGRVVWLRKGRFYGGG